MPHIPLFSSFWRQITTVTAKFKSKNSNYKTLSALQSCKSTEDLKKIHAQLIITGQIKNTFIATKTVESYAVSARNIDYAFWVFVGINYPDSYSWTTMIRGFVEAKNPEKALEFYGLMRQRGVELNKFTFLFVLKAYGLRPSYQEGRIVHGKLVKVGFCYDVFTRNALIHMYLKCGSITDAHLLFDEMPNHNVVTWNTMITGCFGCGDTERACRLFGEMPERNVGSWNAVVGGYSKLGHVDIARSLFDLMPERDVVSWGSMISAYVQNGRAAEALELFKEMMLAGVSADSIIITSILSACAQIGALDMGRWIHAYMKRSKLRNDVFLDTALVDMYAKCGCIDTAFGVFNTMPRKNLCSWNAMLSGLAIHGHGFAALELFKQMESTGVGPNDITFVAVLSACSHIGSVEEGWKKFNQMNKEFNITPKVEHYGCMVDILCRQGLINEAKEIIRTMPMEPNVVIWGALLNACKVHGYTNVGEDVVGYIQKLVSEDGGCYVLLSNIFAAKSQWNEVEKTRKMMKQMGVEKKIPGYSSIELDSVVHDFFAEDRLHSKWREVSAVIERLNTHLEVKGYEANPSLVLYNIDE
ncbi:pentatricopeptide repeat-containing protein At1g08070, chloroplastic-like [Vitis riparia]|uniref:pentatricopeptide repeat-containing protein At1g08070, chloroplastic-like n=1 Tax=Vitis riparia TaxID=96939 RepID=UPI00155A8416|nr:pentatricopeptide repeat-containing protein At1g08070, chloroplastic-like [Vitis riparia]